MMMTLIEWKYFQLRTAIEIMPNAQINTAQTKINPLYVEGRLWGNYKLLNKPCYLFLSTVLLSSL